MNRGNISDNWWTFVAGSPWCPLSHWARSNLCCTSVEISWCWWGKLNGKTSESPNETHGSSTALLISPYFCFWFSLLVVGGAWPFILCKICSQCCCLHLTTELWALHIYYQKLWELQSPHWHCLQSLLMHLAGKVWNVTLAAPFETCCISN